MKYQGGDGIAGDRSNNHEDDTLARSIVVDESSE